MRNYKNEYKNKLRTADEAVQAVKSGDYVSYGHFAMSPIGLDEALAKRAGELSDVKIKAVMALFVPKTVLADPQKKAFTYYSGFYSPFERKLAEKGLCYYVPNIYAVCCAKKIVSAIRCVHAHDHTYGCKRIFQF